MPLFFCKKFPAISGSFLKLPGAFLYTYMRIGLTQLALILTVAPRAHTRGGPSALQSESSGTNVRICCKVRSADTHQVSQRDAGVQVLSS